MNFDEMSVEPVRPERVLVTTAWSTVKPRPVRWLWHGRLPEGKLVTLAGDPGLGKTTLTCALAAQVSRGGEWPDGAACPKGRTLFVTAEDDVGDTLLPRLLRHGGDPAGVESIDATATATPDGPSQSGAFDLSHVEPLERKIAQLNGLGGPPVRLIVVDPVTAFLGEGNDGHNNAQVRYLLKPLCELAQRAGVCVLLISHFNKNSDAKAIHRTMGSLAFVAAARAAHALVADRDDPARRLFVPLKNNLGQDRLGLAFTIDDGRLTWQPGDVDAKSAFAAPSRDTPTMDDEAATAWLRDRLSAGPREATALREDAKSAGIGRNLFDRARQSLDVHSRRGKDRQAFYHLPGHDADDDAPNLTLPRPSIHGLSPEAAAIAS